MSEVGMIQSLNEGTGAVTLPSAFMTFNSGGSNLQLWATNLPAGATAGPFTLTNSASGVIATFQVNGYVLNTSTNQQVATFSGMFTATFTGVTTTIFNNLPIDGPFTATFGLVATPTPPPHTYSNSDSDSDSNANAYAGINSYANTDTDTDPHTTSNSAAGDADTALGSPRSDGPGGPRALSTTPFPPTVTDIQPEGIVRDNTPC
jgi:hypothetical protein